MCPISIAHCERSFNNFTSCSSISSMRRRQSSIFFTAVPRAGSCLFSRPASAIEFSRQPRSLQPQELPLVQFLPQALSRQPPHRQARQESKHDRAAKFQIQSPAAISSHVSHGEPAPANLPASLRARRSRLCAKLNIKIRWLLPRSARIARPSLLARPKKLCPFHLRTTLRDNRPLLPELNP